MASAIFLDKTLLAVTRVAEQSLFSERFASRRGLLQSLDVRFQIASFAFILIVISILHSPGSLWILYFGSCALAALSRVPVLLFIKRVWLFVPLFSAAIVLPAVLNVVTPGEPMWVLCTLPRSYAWGPYTIPAEITVTRQGFWGAIIFVSRVADSVSFAVLLTLTRRWSDLFAGLRSLFVPRVFIMTLSMTARYLFVFLRLIQDMYRARKSRTIRAFSAAVERSWTASRIGVTFKKSMEMSNDVYLAMLSRGFHGEFKTIDRFRSRPADYVWFAVVLACGGLLVLGERGMLR